MPPSFALLLTVAFIGALFRWDSRRHQESFGGLWLPTIWIFFIGSRFPGQWLAMFGLPLGRGGAEGSPFDAAFFLALILLALRNLQLRGVQFSIFARENTWLTAFFLYCFLAILWSDFPFVAFKRWIKILGHPVMALVVLTHPDPVGAFGRVLKRAGFIMLPLSVLFIKYYPEYGRGFDAWTGYGYNRGISLNKNELGYSCLIFGLFFFWHLLALRERSASRSRRQEMLISVGFLAMVGWLLSVAGSATSLTCLILGTGTMIALKSRIVSFRYFGTIVILISLFAITVESLFDVKVAIIRALGRDPSLTDRAEIWADVLAYPINPILGAGFESFWLGERLDALWAKWWWQPIQSHNGYIETYINLGLIGVVLMGGWIISTFFKAKAELLRDPGFGRFRMAFLFVTLFYNYTEATFKGVHLMWTMFHLISIDYPHLQKKPAGRLLSEN